MPIVTLANWKAYRAYAGTDYDAPVTALIPQIQAEMERVCGRKFDQATYTDEPIDGTGTEVIHTRHWPVVSFASLAVRTDTGSETVDASTYRVATGEFSRGRITLAEPGGVAFSSTDGILTGQRRVPSFAVGRGNYLATYTAGYGGGGAGAIAMPPDLTLAACYLIDHRLSMRGQNLAASQVSMGNETLAFRAPNDYMRMYLTTIGPFRRYAL